jgi:hypothetical protein
MFGAYTAAPADLAVYRILYASYLLLAVVPVGLWLREMPGAFFSPPVGAAALASGFPPEGVVLGLNAALAAAAALLLVGWRTPAASVATGALLLALKTWEYADGKINHDVLVVLAPLVLAGSGWGAALSMDAARSGELHPDRPRGSWALALLAFITGLAMFAAGALKLVTGWLAPGSLSTYGHLVLNGVAIGRDAWLAGAAVKVHSAWLWEPADWVATLLELSFVAAMLHPRALRVAMAAACLFHAGVWLLFDIVFSANVLAYAAFVPYAALLARFPRPGGVPAWPLRRMAAAALGCAAVVLGVAAMALERTVEDALRLQLHEAIVVAGGVVGGVYLGRSARNGASRLAAGRRSRRAGLRGPTT